MEIMTERSLRQMGLAPLSVMCVKEEPPSPWWVHVKREPASPLRCVKDESASLPCNRGLHIGGRVKQGPVSPQRLRRVEETHSRYARIDGPSSLPRCQLRPTKEEVPPAIKKARGRLLHYRSGASVSRDVMSKAERAARQQERYDQHNASRRSAFAKGDVAAELGPQRPKPRHRVGARPLCDHRGDGR